MNKNNEKIFYREVRQYRDPHLSFALISILAPILTLMLLYFFARNTSLINSLWLVPIIGWVYYKLYFPLHDLAHMNMFRKKATNLFFGNLISSIFATPFQAFKSEHIDHHKYHGKIEDPARHDYDIEITNKKELVKFLIAPLFGLTVLQKLRDHYTTKSSELSINRNFDFLGLLFIFVIHASLFTFFYDGTHGILKYLIYVIVPGLTFFLFLSRFRQFLEHHKINFGNSNTNTSNSVSRTFDLSTIENFFLSSSSFKYHFVHHKHPSIPASRLAEVNLLYANKHEEHELHMEKGYFQLFRKIWKSTN